ncbi:UNVERIFIED_CONTAM: hypothetical protein K2H54_055507 [Gekko kuhli]
MCSSMPFPVTQTDLKKGNPCSPEQRQGDGTKGKKGLLRKIFQWRQLENLYFREKKFSVEVHDPRSKLMSKASSMLSITPKKEHYPLLNPYCCQPCPSQALGHWSQPVAVQVQEGMPGEESLVTRSKLSSYSASGSLSTVLSLGGLARE